MAKRQTRRSISVKGLTYQRLQDYCNTQGKAVSGHLEEIIKAALDAVGRRINSLTWVNSELIEKLFIEVRLTV